MNFFRCTDYIPLEDRERLGVSKLTGHRGMLHNDYRDGESIMAVRTDQFRPPRKGEWYLSGASPTAWRAPNDLSTGYRVMRLVVVRRTTTRTLEEVI